MKTKKLTPRNVAPVTRNSVASGSTKASGDISPSNIFLYLKTGSFNSLTNPFAGDDAE